MNFFQHDITELDLLFIKESYKLKGKQAFFF